MFEFESFSMFETESDLPMSLSDILNGSAQNDSIIASDNAETLFGFAGNDTILAAGGDDWLNGNQQADTIYGGQDDDIIYGGQGNDLIFGDAGNDTIYGDKGSDTLTGGDGQDVFAIASLTGSSNLDSADVIVDFNPSQDRIELVNGLTFDELSLSDTGNGVTIQIAETGEFLAVVEGVDIEAIQLDTLIFRSDDESPEPDPEATPEPTPEPTPTPEPELVSGLQPTPTPQPDPDSEPNPQPENTVADAETLNITANSQTVSNSVGDSDKVDLYEFEIDTATQINFKLDGLSTDADLLLFNDEDEDGILDIYDDEELLEVSFNSDSADEELDKFLKAGTYYIQVRQFEGNTDYTLEFSSQQTSEDDTGDTISNAQMLSVTETSQTVSGSVSSSNPVNVYQVEINQDSRINFTLDGLSADADLALYQDFNQDGEIDPDEFIYSPFETGNTPETLDTVLEAGTYYIQVEQFEGDTDYTLEFSKTVEQLPDDGAGNTILDAQMLSVTETLDSVSDFVGSLDLIDLYKFEIEQFSSLNIMLKDLEADADLLLFKDENNNGEFDINEDGEFDPDELLEGSFNSDNDPEELDIFLEAGTYYIQVEQFSGDTTYTLQFNSQTVEDSAGNPSEHTRNLDLSDTPSTVNDSVGDFDTVDLYKFDIDTASQINFKLDGLSADADLLLFKDENNNGEFDVDDELLESSLNPGNDSEELNTFLEEGTYLIQVEQFSGDTNYTLEFQQTVEQLPDDGAGNTIANAQMLTVTETSQTVSDFVGFSDPVDLYKFDLDQPIGINFKLKDLEADADLLLYKYVNDNGEIDPNELLESSLNPGNDSEELDTFLEAGTYYIQVEQFSGDTNYTLKFQQTVEQLPDDGAGDTISNAQMLTVTETLDSVNDFVGFSDRVDLYRFDLDQTSEINFTLKDLSADADLVLFQGVVNDEGEIEDYQFLDSPFEIGNTPETLNTFLEAGTYFIQVEQFDGDTTYTLEFSTRQIQEELPKDNAGDTLGEAQNLDLSNSSQTVNDFVGDFDPLDLYKFEIEQPSSLNVNLTLSGLNEDADADLQLIQDVNEDGEINDEIDVITGSYSGGTDDETLELEELAPGTYFLDVSQFSGDTNYQLTVEVAALPGSTDNPDRAGNTLDEARDLGNLSGTQIVEDFVSTIIDPEDFYQFTLTEDSDVELKLTDLEADADLYLIEDTDGDKQLDPEEILAVSLNNGNESESLLETLEAGTYFVEVYSFEGDTDYTLQLSVTSDSSNSAPSRTIQKGSNGSGTRGLSVNLALQRYYKKLLGSSEIAEPGYKSWGYGNVNAAYAVAVAEAMQSNSNLSVTEAVNQTDAFADVDDYVDDTSLRDELNDGNEQFLDYGINQINAPEVWAKGYTGEGVIVAVIDDGVDYRHFDLDANIWENENEKPNDNLDNDNNGYTDDYYGYNFSDQNSDPIGSAEDSHGTHVAGSIAAERNGYGTVGVAPDATIMVLRALETETKQKETETVTEETEKAIAEAIRYAVDNGAQVINMSLGGQNPSEEEEEALEYAQENGVVVVAASGNERITQQATQPDYPALYAQDNLAIAVGAVNKDLKLAIFSNPASDQFGAYPFVTAPGVNVYSTLPRGIPSSNQVTKNSETGYFGSESGTSMATPHVAGVVALMLEANPKLTPDQVADILTQTATTEGLSV